MSEAAIDTIERGAFQRTPQIQAIVLNKNRLSQYVVFLGQSLQFFRGCLFCCLLVALTRELFALAMRSL
ncbi:unnamed protein product [Cylicostephanus goldi]|uniref:Uncharacterized protein n=1 Tax=Cylicostephanus goldi TaxID=71465 RepID=A0A3P6U7X5_CYLGO|nr:unnamed protein product [Cylicostephanus goldi]